VPLVEFMSARAWIHAEGAVALFEQAKAWLRREWVPLPGVSVLARLVATVREGTDQRMYQTLAEAGRAERGDGLAPSGEPTGSSGAGSTSRAHSLATAVWYSQSALARERAGGGGIWEVNDVHASGGRVAVAGEGRAATRGHSRQHPTR